MESESFLESLNREIVECRMCPRLVAWREEIAATRRKSFADWDYWARAVPIFGDPEADRMVLGLAPAAHGANRTGRMFTGDRSGEWLFRALYKAGIASQPTSTDRNDGLALKGALMAATAHCAPPHNKPLPQEVANCSTYLRRLLASRSWSAFLCLGSIAWDHLHRQLGERKPPFGHLATHRLANGALIVASYHPSQQNTFTGKLTEPMLDEAIQIWLRG